MSRLTRDGTTEPVSRDHILRREHGQEIFIFPAQLTASRIDNLTRLIHTLATWHMCDQPATQTNRDPNRDKILAGSNQPRTSKTYRRHDDVLGYELQFLLSVEVLRVFQNLNYKLQRKAV